MQQRQDLIEELKEIRQRIDTIFLIPFKKDLEFMMEIIKQNQSINSFPSCCNRFALFAQERDISKNRFASSFLSLLKEEKLIYVNKTMLILKQLEKYYQSQNKQLKHNLNDQIIDKFVSQKTRNLINSQQIIQINAMVNKQKCLLRMKQYKINVIYQAQKQKYKFDIRRYLITKPVKNQEVNNIQIGLLAVEQKGQHIKVVIPIKYLQYFQQLTFVGHIERILNSIHEEFFYKNENEMNFYKKVRRKFVSIIVPNILNEEQEIKTTRSRVDEKQLREHQSEQKMNRRKKLIQKLNELAQLKNIQVAKAMHFIQSNTIEPKYRISEHGLKLSAKLNPQHEETIKTLVAQEGRNGEKRSSIVCGVSAKVILLPSKNKITQSVNKKQNDNQGQQDGFISTLTNLEDYDAIPLSYSSDSLLNVDLFGVNTTHCQLYKSKKQNLKFKASFVVKNQLSETISAMMDVENYHQWHPNAKNIKLIEFNGTKFTYQIEFYIKNLKQKLIIERNIYKQQNCFFILQAEKKKQQSYFQRLWNKIKKNQNFNFQYLIWKITKIDKQSSQIFLEIQIISQKDYTLFLNFIANYVPKRFSSNIKYISYKNVIQNLDNEILFENTSVKNFLSKINFFIKFGKKPQIQEKVNSKQQMNVFKKSRFIPNKKTKQNINTQIKRSQIMSDESEKQININLQAINRISYHSQKQQKQKNVKKQQQLWLQQNAKLIESQIIQTQNYPPLNENKNKFFKKPSFEKRISPLRSFI